MPNTMLTFLNKEQLINNLAVIAAEAFSDVCVLADNTHVKRDYALAIYAEMIEGLIENIDVENYDPTDKSHFS